MYKEKFLDNKNRTQNRTVFHRAGFSVLELVVVLLIMAIFAAILLPRYQRLLLKSRVGSVASVVASVAEAQEVFYMSHGKYASKREGLTLSVPIDSKQVDLAISEEDKYKFVIASHPQAPEVRYVVYQKYSKNFPDNIHCEAKTEDKDAVWLCEEEYQGVKLAHGSISGADYTTYIVKGSASDGSFSQTYYNTSHIVVEGGSRCESTEQGGCSHSSFSGGSTCQGSQGSSCQYSTFTDSECYGDGRGGKIASTVCGYNTYINSSCYNESGDGYVCGRSAYEDNSSCYGNEWGGCGHSTFSDNSSCYGQSYTACEDSTFTDSSTCVAEGTGGCRRSNFTDSTCYARSGGTSSARSCGSGSTYTNSTCYNQSSDMYGCGAATYTAGSACHSNASGGCGGKSTFSGGSSCYGNGAGGCGGNTYTGGSVCYANAAGACNNNTYSGGSYCSGSHCPAGSPRQDGTIRTAEGD
ncbi:MAG: prepilin-type N-terminal cleavage/methylation domain-containing protein [Elusimicrobiaceae bacterium]|nr:prepilin-type N-terminal cleavage/methylation domain-containing protein [Elusimicrobiaceae bacterium]